MLSFREIFNEFHELLFLKKAGFGISVLLYPEINPFSKILWDVLSNSISESPKRAGVIWAGTDDGRVHFTPDFGKTWKEVTQNLVAAGAPADRWVNRIVASNFNDSVAYLCKSGFKFDDFSTYIYKTTDMGDTWTDISGNLPDQPVNVIVEDMENRQLLFVGNDIGIYFTLDGGTNWQRMEGNIPFVPVKDLVIHTREKDLVAGTYGRGVFITNINAVEQITPEIFEKDVFFFDILPKPVRNVSDAAYWGNNRLMGDKHLFTHNEPNGLRFDYYLKEEQKHEPQFLIYDEKGRAVDTLQGTTVAGLNTVYWRTWSEKPGTYKIVLKNGKQKIAKYAVLKPRIVYPVMNYRGND